MGSKSAEVATVRARLGCCGHLAGSERPVVARVTRTATPTLVSNFGKKCLLLPVCLKDFTFGVILKNYVKVVKLKNIPLTPQLDIKF